MEQQVTTPPPPEILAALRAWPDRWRFPGLLPLLSSGEAAADELVDAVLEGCTDPVADPEESVRRLLGQGDHRAAREAARAGDPGALRLVEEHVAGERIRLDRRIGRLLRRSRKARIPSERVPFAPEEVLALGRGAAGAALRDWEARIAEQEERLRDRLSARAEERFAGGGPQDEGLLEAARNCLKGGEFDAAERLIALPPGAHSYEWPEYVRPWRWSGLLLPMPVPEALAMYREGAWLPTGFAESWWPETGTGRGLVEALRGVQEEPSADAVRALALAWDAHLGEDASGGRPVRAVGEGWCTELLGAAEERFPWLPLPRPLPLWVGPPGWRPPAGAAGIRLALDGAPPPQGAEEAAGPVAVDARRLLCSVAPGGPGTTAFQRVNLLREVCRRLSPAQVTGADSPYVAAGERPPALAVRNELAWWFDLLGVGVDPGVLDTLLDETDEHPVALRAAVDFLVRDARAGTGRLRIEDVDRWREDRGALLACHEQVLGAERLTGEAALVLRVLLLFGEALEDRIGPAEVSSAFEYAGVAEPFAQSTPEQLLARIERFGVLLRAEGGDPGGYRWASPRLTGLLASVGEEHLRRAVADGVRHVLERRERAVAALRPRLADMYEEIWRHNEKSRQAGQDRPPVGKDEYREARIGRIGRGERSRLDLPLFLGRCRNGLGFSLPPEVRVDRLEVEEPEAGAWVWANEDMLRVAVDALLDNAVQAVRAAGGGRVRMALRRIRYPGHDAPSGVEVDIEDSGAGLDEERIRLFNDHGWEEIWEDGSGLSGRGVAIGKAGVLFNDGNVQYFPRSEGLGGARVRLRFPLARELPGEGQRAV
ncbi:ATP-binding protein [Nocardiopsis potens]|uniref:ATP-binding protein n=1 Tax=Nocardiopsis potens TaxID=1246458 RepID=UPI00037D9511|nr:ATP-binding protein [Nocardiopsis potens]